MKTPSILTETFWVFFFGTGQSFETKGEFVLYEFDETDWDQVTHMLHAVEQGRIKAFRSPALYCTLNKKNMEDFLQCRQKQIESSPF